MVPRNNSRLRECTYMGETVKKAVSFLVRQQQAPESGSTLLSCLCCTYVRVHNKVCSGETERLLLGRLDSIHIIDILRLIDFCTATMSHHAVYMVNFVLLLSVAQDISILYLPRTACCYCCCCSCWWWWWCCCAAPPLLDQVLLLLQCCVLTYRRESCR